MSTVSCIQRVHSQFFSFSASLTAEFQSHCKFGLLSGGSNIWKSFLSKQEGASDAGIDQAANSIKSALINDKDSTIFKGLF